MQVEKLTLYHFRNFAGLTTALSPRLNLIVGRNAQGKTNLIEAINLVSALRSFRTNQLRELIQWGEEEMSVFVAVRMAQRDLELGVAVTRTGRQAYLNGDATDAAGFMGRLCCVTFTPSDLALVKGAPEGRRKFLDRHLIDLNPALIRDLLEYNRALKSKNRILKGRQVTKDMLRAWNEIMIRSSLQILEARRIFLGKLEAHANTIHSRFGGGDGRLGFQLKGTLHHGAHEVTRERLAAKFEEELDREIALRSALVGPHRDDLGIKIGEHDAKAYASQGQARSIVLSMKLAVIELIERERGDSPVVLLDDVDSELDEARREALFEAILSQERQVFITGTDRHMHRYCAGREHRQMRLQDGALIAMEP